MQNQFKAANFYCNKEMVVPTVKQRVGLNNIYSFQSAFSPVQPVKTSLFTVHNTCQGTCCKELH